MKSFLQRGGLLLGAALIVCGGCSRSDIDEKVWKFSGTDKNRGIDHYYSPKSVSRPGKDLVRVKTKGVPHKDKKAVETSTGVKGAYSFEVDFEMSCAEKYVRVLGKEYLDEKGNSLKKEKDEDKVDTFRPMDPAMPLYGCFKDLCGNGKLL
jgi:hypothetical protein